MVLLSTLILQKKFERPSDLKVKKRAFGAKGILPIIGFTIAVVAALYPIYIYPLYSTDYYKEIQKKTRRDIDQAAIQPGGMRVWSDPFKDQPESPK